MVSPPDLWIASTFAVLAISKSKSDSCRDFALMATDGPSTFEVVEREMETMDVSDGERMEVPKKAS